MEMIYGRPYPDKLSGVEFIGASTEQVAKIVALNSPACRPEGSDAYRRAMPYLQVCNAEEGYMFVEFWSTVGEKIGAAVEFLEKYMATPVEEDEVEETPPVPGASVGETPSILTEPEAVATTSGENMSGSGTD